MTLYDLTSDYLYLLDLMGDPDIDIEVINDTLEALDGEIEAKADGYAIIMKELEASAEAIKKEEEMKISGTKDNLIAAIATAQLEHDTVYDCEIKKHRKKRSLDANNYAWLLMDRIAKAVRSQKDEVYLQMLERYGSFFYLPVQTAKVEEVTPLFRIVHDRGGVNLTTESGKQVECRQLQCYKGSSLYDTKEMSELLDGIVSEAKELGIETETPEEIERMKSQWGVKL